MGFGLWVRRVRMLEGWREEGGDLGLGMGMGLGLRPEVKYEEVEGWL